MSSFRLAITLVFVLTLGSIVGCKSNPTDPGSTKITTGASVDLVTQSVPSSGGTIRVNKPGDSLNGLTIDVANGAYTDSRNFHISYAPITNIENGEGAIVISPMIIVDNGGGYAESPMIMKIPVTIPSDMFAMAFAYDESNGLEGMPVLDEDQNSLTIWTTHFEHSAAHEGFGKMSASAAGQHRSMLVVIAEKKEKIMAATVPTSFTPGKDDWSFRNRGSMIAPRGHCAGQTLGMMYYYIDHKMKGEPGLFGRFDNDDEFPTPNIWQDDRSAYRYCSTLQHEGYKHFLSTTVSVDNALIALGKSESFRDSLMFMAFKLSMYRTKSPQFVSIRTVTRDSGHAMTVYSADANGLSVCDPNYPGATDRRISFSNGHFETYFSGPSADQLGVAFPVIQYLGMTSSMRWDIANREWPKLLDHTVGVSLFPTLDILVRDDMSKPQEILSSPWKTSASKVQIDLDDPTLTVDTLFRTDGSKIIGANGWFDIPVGQNKLGFYVEEIAAGNEKKKWAGFKWVTVEVTQNDTTLDSTKYPPPYDNLFVSVSAGGGGADISDNPSFYFSISDTSLNINASKSPGDAFQLIIRHIKGKGTYFPRDGYQTIYFRDTDYTTDVLDSGSATITEWGNGKFAGTYTTTIRRRPTYKDSIDVTVSGSFHYPK